MTDNKTAEGAKREEKAAREWDDEEEESEEGKVAEVAEESQEQSPLMRIAQLKFLLARPDDLVPADEKRQIQMDMMEQINRDSHTTCTTPQHSTARADSALPPHPPTHRRVHLPSSVLCGWSRDGAVLSVPGESLRLGAGR